LSAPNDRDLTNRRIQAVGDGPEVEGQIESRLPFGSGAEGLCHTMPELGSIPFVQGRATGRRVVRLVAANEGSDLSIELQAGVNKIGRQRNGNHIVLVSGEISRFHAELHVSNDAIVVRDLGSSNGTFVNQQKVSDAHGIEAGDLVGFSSQFLFKVQIDLAMQAPEVMTLDPGGLPQNAPPPAPPAGEIPVSLEERRRKLETAPNEPVSRTTAPRGVAPLPRPAAAPRPAPVAPAAQAQRPTPIVPGPSRSPGASAPAPMPAPVQPTPSGPVQPPQPARLRAPVPAPDHRPPPAVGGPPPRTAAPVLPDQQLPRTVAPVLPEPGGISAQDSLLDPIKPVEDPSGDMVILERERRQLAVLYQVSKRCMAAENLAELDRLLINVLERIVAFERGFITYQLPSGDWKLVMSPKGDRWDRSVVRGLLQTALRGKTAVVVKNSASDDQLGNPGPNRTDARLLLPLRTRSAPVGAIFLISSRSDCFDDQTVDFLSLFSDIAALAVVSCARMEGRTS
jgi:pSer/pThr/pTyr-binding forkhead associated (FHA) protein